MSSRTANSVQHLVKQMSTLAMNGAKERTAGIIVIGDEILKGQVHDTNSYFVAKKLYGLGVKVQKVSVVGDDMDTISNEVRTFSEKFKFVITTGGIGPTHDDITFGAVAKAFGETVAPHPELVKIISAYYKTEDLSSAPMKMAHVPASARIKYGSIDGKKTAFPNVSIQNVFMFPGIPQLMERLFDSLCEELFGGSQRKFFMKELFIKAPEAQIADTLSAAARSNPHVTIGSYPKLFNCYYNVEITVESENEKETDKVYSKLKSALHTVVVDYDKNPLEAAYDKLQKLAHTEPKASVINQAINIIKEAITTYSRSEELCLYLDGTPRSMVLLHLYYTVIQQYSPGSKIHAVCIKAGSTSEVEAFLEETIKRYDLNFAVLECSMESVCGLLTKRDPSIKAVLAAFSEAQSNESDSSMWILPLAEWDNDLLWNVINSLYLPYCPLYKDENRTRTP